MYKIKEPSTKNKILIITNSNAKQPDLKERAAVYKKNEILKNILYFHFWKIDVQYNEFSKKFQIYSK